MIYLHIGPPKTGSTTIQHWLRSFDRQSNPPLWYVRAGRCSSGSTGSAARSGTGRTRHRSNDLNHTLIYRALAGHLSDEVSARLLQELREEIGTYSGQKIVLSSEGFAGLDRAIPRLLKLFGHEGVRVIFYLRHPAKRIISAYRERIRTLNETATFRDYLRERSFRGTLLNGHKVISRWCCHVGGEQFEVKHFDQIVSCGDLVSDFAETLGVDKGPVCIDPANESLDDTSLKAIRALSRLQGRVSHLRVGVLITANLKRAIDRRRFAGRIFKAIGNFSFGPLISKSGEKELQEQLRVALADLSASDRKVYESFEFATESSGRTA